MARFVTLTRDRLREGEQFDCAFAGDLWRLDLEGELEREFRETLDGHQVVCYHATRLLPHELEDIPRAGLHVLSDDLRARKLAAACSHHPDILSESDARLLLDNGPLSWQGTADARNGSLCFVTPWTAVVGEDNGLSHLFGRWGGEAIGWTTGDATQCEDVLMALDRLSIAAVVEFALEIHDFADWRPLWFVPVGLELGLANPWTESRTSASVPPERVTRVLTADHPGWPRELQERRRSR